MSALITEMNNKPNRSIRKVKLDIAAAKRAMDATTRGTPERDAAFLRFVDLQKELGAIELRALGIEPVV